MQVQSFLSGVDRLSTWVGKASAWLILVLMAIVCLDVANRYIFNDPSQWAFEISVMLYGALFMLSGAYTLAQDGHVRGDFLYGSMPPRRQASLDLLLYLLFFIPGIVALCWSGIDFAADSWRIHEHSSITADGPPLYHFKTLIPIAGLMVLIQGFAEIVRCVVCLKTGQWPARLADVEEIDVVKTQLEGSTLVDEASRREVISKVEEIEQAAHGRGAGEHS